MQDNDALALATSNATTFLLYFILFALITSPATLLKNIFACWEISRSRRLSTAQNAQGRSFGVLRPFSSCDLAVAYASLWLLM